MTTLLAAEQALLDLVRAYTGGTVFDDVNAAIEEWDVLDAPNTDYAAVVEMEGPSEEADELDGYGVHGGYVERHRLAVWVCVSRGTGDGGDGEVRTVCKTVTEALKDHLRPYERLDSDMVLRADIRQTSEPRYIAPVNDPEAATHVAQQISLVVLCGAMRESVETAEV